jgi:hypothetical protein
MKGFENEIYYYLLIISNVVALIMLFAAVRKPRFARLLFFLLFAWACWMNWTTASEKPQVYLNYADLTWSSWYYSFIHGWFASHIKAAVGFIAISQGLIAISMLMSGWLFRLGAIGAIVFLLAIVPFGVGSGFPTTLIMTVAMIIILAKHVNNFIWISNRQDAKLKRSNNNIVSIS